VLKALTNDILMKNTLTTLKLNLTRRRRLSRPFHQTIVEEVSNSDHQISLREVQEVAARLSWGLCCFRRDARPTRVWSHGAMQTKQVLCKTARPATPNDSRGVPRPGRNYTCKEKQSVLMAQQFQRSSNSCPTIPSSECDVQGLSQKFAKASSGVPNW